MLPATQSWGYIYNTRLSSSSSFYTIIKNIVYNIDDNLKLISHPNKLNKAQKHIKKKKGKINKTKPNMNKKGEGKKSTKIY